MRSGGTVQRAVSYGRGGSLAIHSLAATARNLHFAASRETDRSGQRRRCGVFPNLTEEGVVKMLAWALVFFVIALIAGLFGFEIIETGAANVALILFFVFLVLFVISLIAGYRRRPTV